MAETAAGDRRTSAELDVDMTDGGMVPSRRRWKWWGSGSVGLPCSALGAADVDVAPTGAGADLDGVLGLPRSVRRSQGVAYLAAAGAGVEPGGGALPDADVDGPVIGLQLDRAAAHAVHA